MFGCHPICHAFGQTLTYQSYPTYLRFYDNYCSYSYHNISLCSIEKRTGKISQSFLTINQKISIDSFFIGQ